MQAIQLAFKYLVRNKGRTVLLLLVLLMTHTLILGTNMMMQATEHSKQLLEEKTNSKIVVETTQPLNGRIIDQIQHLSGVSFLNCIGRQVLFPENFHVITMSDSLDEDNLSSAVITYSDLQRDGPFADGIYRLADGNYIKLGKKGAVVHMNLAQQNGLSIGESIIISNRAGKTVTVPIIGLFRSVGNVEKDQPDATGALNRIENQIFVDQDSYKKCIDTVSYDSLCVYLENPKNADALKNTLRHMLGKNVVLNTADALYSQLMAPLEQASNVASLMRTLAVFMGTTVSTLLLCLWMKSRQKEIAVYMSLGRTKGNILGQLVMESGGIFILSIIGTMFASNGIAAFLKNMVVDSNLINGNMKITVQDIGLLILLGFGMILVAQLFSVIPILKSKPKDILTKMEG